MTLGDIRRGGNYTQPHREYGQDDVVYLVFVGGERQLDEFPSAIEAEVALREKMGCGGKVIDGHTALGELDLYGQEIEAEIARLGING